MDTFDTFEPIESLDSLIKHASSLDHTLSFSSPADEPDSAVLVDFEHSIGKHSGFYCIIA